jgi:probable blue pigment (indigoidine) exporter
MEDYCRMRDIGLTALAPLIWGTTYIVTTEFLPPDRPLLAGLMRALPVGLLLLIMFRHLPVGVWWGRTLVLGALNIGLFFPLFFLAVYRLPGGVAATLSAFQPFLVALFGWPLLDARPGRRTILAAGAGLLGIAMLVLGPAARLDGLGVVAGLGGAALMALATVLGKRWGRPAPVLVFTAWQLVAGGLILVPLTLAFEGPPPPLTGANWLGFAYLGLINTGLAYAIWFRGVVRLPATAITFLMLLSPVGAVILGFVVLGQTLSVVQIAGALLVLGSVIAGQRPDTRAVPAGAPAIS